MSKQSVHQRKARTFIQNEDWGNALAELQRMLGADGDNPTLHNQIGDVYLRKDDIGQACDHFERAIDLYAAVGLHNNAVALCKKVMRLRPGRHEMRYRLARLRMDQGFPGEAATFLREYFDHVSPHEAHIEAFEGRCREIIDLMPDVAPVGKILEKLEAAKRYVTAFDIVRKQAKRAADAGDSATAGRYTEKMRSLRILVERSGGRDLLAELGPAPETPPAASGDVPKAADADPLVGAGDVASLLLPDAKPQSSPAPDAAAKASPALAKDAPATPAKPAQPRWFVDPNTLPGLEAAAASSATTPSADAAARLSKPAAAAPEISLADVESARSASADSESAGSGSPDPALLDAALFTPRSTESESSDTVSLDSTFVSAESPPSESADAALVDAGEPGSVPEYDLSESTFADLAMDLASHPGPNGPAARSDDIPEWSADAGPAEPAPADAVTTNGANGRGRSAHPTPDPQPAADADGGDAAPPPVGASWVDALRRTPLWIPSESAPPSATPEGWAAGANMELESVIDSFREQMARALDGDGAARYDLGVAYYEMGLYNEALAEFEAASRCPGLEVQSYEMLAACLLQTDRHAEVVELLLPVLAADGHSPRGRLGLQYSLGLAYEALGDREQARRCFEEVALVDIDFKDVQARLQSIA